MASDEDYDALFSAPIDEFVARRDALVKQLRASGDRDQAAAVKAWRRPSRVVGALNRLALSGDDSVPTFVDAARAVGSSSGAALREANDAFRAAVRDAASAAVDRFDEVRPSDLGEVTSALLTVGADPEALESFEAGRLLDLPDAGQAGFGFGFGMAAEPAAARPRAAPKGKAKGGKPKGGKAAGDDAEARRREAAARARADAEAELASATEAHESADAALDDARAAVESAEEDLEAAKAALTEAKAARTAAEKAFHVATKAVAKAEAELARLDD